LAQLSQSTDELEKLSEFAKASFFEGLAQS
jgi:hypothetical protein